MEWHPARIRRQRELYPNSRFNSMKHLFYYLLTAVGVVFLFEAFSDAPKSVAPAASATGTCMRDASATHKTAANTTSHARATAIFAKGAFSPEACAECHEDEVA